MRLGLLIGAAWLASVAPSWAAINCADANATSNHTTTTDSTISISYTTPSPCVDCVTFIGGGGRGGTLATVTAATIGGNSATAATAGSGTSSSFGRLYRYANPPAGTNTVTVTFGDTITSRHIAVVTCTGVDTTDPIRDSAVATAVSTAPSVTVASVNSTDVVLDWQTSDDSATQTVGANQTVITGTLGSSATSNAAMSQQAGSDGGVMSWTLVNSNRWSMNAVSIKAAPVVEGGGAPLWFN